LRTPSSQVGYHVNAVSIPVLDPLIPNLDAVLWSVNIHSSPNIPSKSSLISLIGPTKGSLRARRAAELAVDRADYSVVATWDST
jgi:hypothetical protein